jgi:hypothetical protein
MIWFGACLSLGWNLYHTFDEVNLSWFEGQIEIFRWNIAQHNLTLSDPTNALMFYGLIGIIVAASLALGCSIPQCGIANGASVKRPRPQSPSWKKPH